MKSLFLEKNAEIQALLTLWFDQKFTRHQLLPFDETQFATDIALCAARIFKRGAQGIKKIHSGEIFRFQEHAQFDSVKDNNEPFRLLTKQELEQTLFSAKQKDTFLIIDQNMASLYPEWCKEFSTYFILESNEKNKNIETIKEILNALPEGTRKIYALGGGILLDIAGFAAGLAHIPIEYVATTLLAAVDAGLGGKTGVNFYPYGKNQLGLFVTPAALNVVPEYFASLPSQEILCGLGEALKHAWLQGNFAENRELFLEVLQKKQTTPSFQKLILLSYAVKKKVVMADPLEKGVRAILNLGHTIAHVLEGLGEKGFLSKTIPHGIAVAYGMLFLLEHGFIAGPDPLFSLFLKDLIATQEKLLLKKEIPIPEVKQTILDLLLQDKKNIGSSFVSLTTPPYGFLQRETFLQEKGYMQEVDTKAFVELLLHFFY